jgi:Molybdopterin converting factor, large subunit
MTTRLRDEAFDPWTELRDYSSRMQQRSGKFGATAIFVGTMRDFNAGETVRRLNLEHYPGMTEKYLKGIETGVARRWPILDSLIVHRVGRVLPGDPIVLVAVWSAHRGTAFDACRYLIEELKHRAPFWKKEEIEAGVRWVESNTSA